MLCTFSVGRWEGERKIEMEEVGGKSECIRSSYNVTSDQDSAPGELLIYLNFHF